MNCPYCKKRDPVPSIAIEHADAYGGSTSNVLCKYCKEPIVVHTCREVIVEDIIVGTHNKDNCDFAMFQMFPDEDKGGASDTQKR